MKAIQTEWHGCRFRSRLEARWAVVFEAMGIDWEYEPEGFVLDDGTWYLPDFLLHGIKGDNGHEYLSDNDTIETRDGRDGDVWVEVKPHASTDEDDFKKVCEFAKERPIVIATSLPDAGSLDEFVDSVDNLSAEWPHPFATMIMEGYTNGGSSPIVVDKGGDARIVDIGNLDSVKLIDERATLRAYAAGRKARFEHGEKPGMHARQKETKRKLEPKESFRGHRVFRRKLTPDEALAIYDMDGTYSEIAKRFNTSTEKVKNIKTGKTFHAVTHRR